MKLQEKKYFTRLGVYPDSHVLRSSLLTQENLG